MSQQKSKASRKILVSADKIAKVVCAVLDDKKAEDIITLNLVGRSTIADYMVIATGHTSRQIIALMDHILVALKSMGVHASVEGLPYADWLLIDAGDVIIHLFHPETRRFYNLEKMWGPLSPSDNT